MRVLREWNQHTPNTEKHIYYLLLAGQKIRLQLKRLMRSLLPSQGSFFQDEAPDGDRIIEYTNIRFLAPTGAQ